MAAACSGSLQHIFESPLPENPTLIESLASWNKIKSMKPPIEQSSFTEIFGELHFKENPSSSTSSLPSSSSSSSSPLPLSSSSSSSSFFIDFNAQPAPTGFETLIINNSPSSDSFPSSTQKSSYANGHKNSDSFSSMNSESLQLCTEGLGFESCDDVEDMSINNWQIHEEDKGSSSAKHSPPSGSSCGEMFRRSPRRSNGSVAFPPPISCIGKSGKPWVCFKSYRHDGRFVLKEVRIPTQEFLHACREDGRLKLHFVQPEDELLEEEEEEEEEYDVDDEMGNEDDERGNKAEISGSSSL